MSEPRRVLNLVVEGLSAERRKELDVMAAGTGAEIFELTEKNAAAALEKIFTADTVAVWGEV